MNPNTITRTFAVLLLLAATSACSQGVNPLAPTVSPAETPKVITYAINIPDADLARKLQAQFPDGIAVPPIVAQVEYDFTSTYHGSNVYYGPNAPQPGAYVGVGIVVAPTAVADRLNFTAADWPAMAVGLPSDTPFSWLGRFVFTAPVRA